MSAVRSFRAFVRAHPYVAALLVASALLLRIAVPAGFMPMIDNGHIVVRVCDGMVGSTMVIAIPGLEHKSDGPKTESRCAFADLSLPSLGGADPIQMAALFAFILALGFAMPIRSPNTPALRLRPPLRGPPAFA